MTRVIGVLILAVVILGGTFGIVKSLQMNDPHKALFFVFLMLAAFIIERRNQ